MMQKYIKSYNEGTSIKKKASELSKEEFTEMFQEVFDLGIGKVSVNISHIKAPKHSRYELRITELEYPSLTLELLSDLVTTLISCSKRMPENYETYLDPCFDLEESTISVVFHKIIK